MFEKFANKKREEKNDTTLKQVAEMLMKKRNLNAEAAYLQARTYIDFEIGCINPFMGPNIVLEKVYNNNFYEKWIDTFSDFLIDINENGKYYHDKEDCLEYIRGIYTRSLKLDISESIRNQTIMSFAVALALYDFQRVFSKMIKNNPICMDEKYKDMFIEFSYITPNR